MGKMNVVLDDELEKELREKAFNLNHKKGSISEAVSEAVRDWLTKKEN